MSIREARRRPIVICPTSNGGHMDHAMDLALSAAEQGYPRPLIVSRPGSLEYVPRAVLEHVDVLESLPPLAPSGAGRFRRLAVMMTSLVQEHYVVRRLGRRTGDSFTLVFQEPRYPWPKVLVSGTRGANCTLILHNAVEHTGSAATLSSRVQSWIRSSCLRHADRIVTFGDAQARIARTLTGRPVRSFVLPRSTRIVHDHAEVDGPLSFPGLLCIGELRPNKGIEVAIEAAGELGEVLHVVGRKVEDEYFRRLAELAAKYDSVTLTAQFLSAAEFDRAVASADCVLLPYVQFDAQSGVLAKASAFGVPMIASDLPSLREQARTDDDIVMVRPGSVPSLSAAIEAFRLRQVSQERVAVSDLHEWDLLVRACVEGW